MTLLTRVLLWLLPAMLVLAVGQFLLFSKFTTRDATNTVSFANQNSNNPASQIGVPIPTREYNNSLPLPTTPATANSVAPKVVQAMPQTAKPVQSQTKPSTVTTTTKPVVKPPVKQKAETSQQKPPEIREPPRVSSPAVAKPNTSVSKPVTPVLPAPAPTPVVKPPVADDASLNPVPVVTSSPTVETPVKPNDALISEPIAGASASVTPAPAPITSPEPSEVSPPTSEVSVPAAAKPEPSNPDQGGSQTSNLEKTDTQPDTSSQNDAADTSSRNDAADTSNQDNLAVQTPDLQTQAAKPAETPAPVIVKPEDKPAPATETLAADAVNVPVKPKSDVVLAQPRASTPTTNKINSSGSTSIKPKPQVKPSKPATTRPNLKPHTPAAPVQVQKPSGIVLPATPKPSKPVIAMTPSSSVPTVQPSTPAAIAPVIIEKPQTPDRLSELEQLTANGDVLVHKRNGRLEFEAVSNQNNWILLSSVGLLVLALGLGAFGVRRSLTPLYTLAGEIERRNASSLGMIATPPMPELRPAVSALNRLLLDMGETLERLKTQEASARRFAYNASHELRNPLTATRNYLEVLERHPTQVEATQGALNALDRTERILSSLLQLARLEGQGTPKRERIDLSSFIEAHFDVPVEGQAEVWAERDLLELSLENLVNNAANHAGGAKNIRVETRADGTWLWVEDAGPGFNSEILPRAFEPFAKHGAGTGLGLAIVEAVARVHGGTVRAENRLEGGARVGLSLPAFFV